MAPWTGPIIRGSGNASVTPRQRIFGILGPLQVRAGDRVLAITGRRQRALLGILLLNANRVVSAERLLDELWAGSSRSRA